MSAADRTSRTPRAARRPRRGLGFFRPPLRRLTITVIVLAVLAGGVVWYFGVGIAQSALLTAAFAAIGLTWLGVQEGESIDWPQPPARRTPGARRDLESLSWSMKTRGGVAGQSLSRVREAMRHRLLFLYGLDLYDDADLPAIEALVAPAVVRILLSPRQSNLDLAAFTRCLGALERLGTAAGAPSSPTERPTP